MPKYWFKQKSLGVGSTPSTWQGWALTLAAFVLVLAIVTQAMQFPDANTGRLMALTGGVLVFIAYSVIAYIKTEGGWRWRSGKEDN
jgi:lipopolysaccharide export LptBFGC system permease protein LptF